MLWHIDTGAEVVLSHFLPLAFPSGWQISRAEFFDCVLTAIVSAMGLSVILLGLNYLATTISREPIQRHVRQGFSVGQLVESGVTGARDYVRGVHQYNDCLVLHLALDDRGTAIGRSLAPRGMNSLSPCGQLKLELAGDGFHPAQDDRPYTRYVHGLVAFGAALIALLPVGPARLLMQVLAFSTLAALLSAMMFVVWQSRRQLSVKSSGEVRNRGLSAAAFAWVALCLAAFWGLPFYSPNFSHFPSDFTVIGYLVLAAFVNFTALSMRQITIIHVTFGALTIYFEFLTGGIPLGLSLILTVFAIRAMEAGEGVVKKAQIAVLAYVLSIAMVFGLKMITTILYYADTNVIQNFADGINNRTLEGRAGIFDLISALYDQTLYLGMGSYKFGVLLIVGSILCFLLSVARIVWRGNENVNGSAYILFVAAYGVVPVWYLVFLPHSVLHAFFMVRISVALIFIGPLLLLVAFNDPLRKACARWGIVRRWIWQEVRTQQR